MTPPSLVRGAAWLATAVAVLTTAAPAVHATPSQPSAASGPRLELVDQRFAIDPNGDIELSYLLRGLDGDPLGLIPTPAPEPLPPTLPEPLPGAEPVIPPAVVAPEPISLTIEVINYAPLTNAADVSKLVGSDVNPDDFEDIGAAIDGIALDARPLLTRNDDGTVELVLDVGTDVVDSVESRLKFERPGVYPLRIQLLRGDPNANDVIVTAGTVVERLAGAADASAVVAPPIDLSVVSVTPGPPPDADPAAIEASRAQLDAAVDLAATLTSPVTLEVPPTLVAETASTPEGSKRLATALDNDELVALPIVPIDVSSAVAAGRADTYKRLVRSGEDLLTAAVPTTPNSRDVWITTEPLSGAGAQQLRDLGARFVVIPEALFEDSIDPDVPTTDQFVQARLPDGGTLPFLVVDPIADQLTSDAAERILATSTSIEWSVQTLAEMLVGQAAEDASTTASTGVARALPRRSRILTTPDLTSPDPRLLGALDQLAATTPSIRFTAASALTGVTDVLTDDGEPVTIELPAVAGPSLEARVALLDSTAVQLASAASMLPDGDPRIAQWATRLDELISTGYTDAAAEAAAQELLAQANGLKAAVQLPEPFTFTLTGRSGTIEVRISNTIDEPLKVVVALDSTKVNFPGGDQEVTLRPLDETSVIVPVEAESNGTSSITLTASTPAGEVLAEPVTLTARVTALTGLGQVLTGGLVLVLLTWWFTNWRGRRRAALADNGRERHPSTPRVESDAL